MSQPTDNPLTPAQVAKIRERAEVATAGPYNSVYTRSRCYVAGPSLTQIARFADWCLSDDADPAPHADAEYFAALDPATVLALVAAAERLREVLASRDEVAATAAAERDRLREVAEIAADLWHCGTEPPGSDRWKDAGRRWVAIRDSVLGEAS